MLKYLTVIQVILMVQGVGSWFMVQGSSGTPGPNSVPVNNKEESRLSTTQSEIPTKEAVVPRSDSKKSTSDSEVPTSAIKDPPINNKVPPPSGHPDFGATASATISHPTSGLTTQEVSHQSSAYPDTSTDAVKSNTATTVVNAIDSATTTSPLTTVDSVTTTSPLTTVDSVTTTSPLATVGTTDTAISTIETGSKTPPMSQDTSWTQSPWSKNLFGPLKYTLDTAAKVTNDPVVQRFSKEILDLAKNNPSIQTALLLAKGVVAVTNFVTDGPMTLVLNSAPVQYVIQTSAVQGVVQSTPVQAIYQAVKPVHQFVTGTANALVQDDTATGPQTLGDTKKALTDAKSAVKGFGFFRS